jgi:hypothetical protein
MTTTTHEVRRSDHAVLPRLHVGRPLALLRALTVTVVCLALGLGFISTIWRAGAPASDQGALVGLGAFEGALS